jgi:hypothetical protein
MTSPLTCVALFHLGPVPITAGVVATWAIMAVLVLGGILITRRLSLVPSGTQAAFELIVDTVDAQIRDTMRVEPAPYRAFILRARFDGGCGDQIKDHAIADQGYSPPGGMALRWRARAAVAKGGTLIAFTMWGAGQYRVARVPWHSATCGSHGRGGSRRLDRQWRRGAHALPLPRWGREHAFGLDLLAQLPQCFSFPPCRKPRATSSLIYISGG